MSFEHFPSGSLVPPPQHLITRTVGAAAKGDTDMQWFERAAQYHRLHALFASQAQRKVRRFLWYIYRSSSSSRRHVSTHAIRREASLVLQGAPEIVVQRVIAGRHDLIPVGYAQKIGGSVVSASAKGPSVGLLLTTPCQARITHLWPPTSSPLERVAVAIGRGIVRSGSL